MILLPWEGSSLPLQILSKGFLDLTEQVSQSLQALLDSRNVEDVHHQWCLGNFLH